MKNVKGATAGDSEPSKKKLRPKGVNTSSKRTGIKSKPQFKSKGGEASGSKSKGNPVRNHFSFAEEKRLDRIREQNEQKAEKAAKKLQARKEKKRKLKILSKKNRKGQPVMKGRMELLLEKIEKRL